MEQWIVFGVVVAAIVGLVLIVRMPSNRPRTAEHVARESEDVASRPPAEAGGSLSGVVPKEAGSAVGCILLGLVLMFIGFYFLVFNPSVGDDKVLGLDVVNLQRLDIGETCVIAGSIFLAVGIRPRRL